MTTEAKKIDDGGPAFPCPTEASKSHYGTTDAYVGMTLRDYFAARAPQEIPDWFRRDYHLKNWKSTAVRPASFDNGLCFQNPRIRQAIREWWKSYKSPEDKLYDLESVGEFESEREFLRKWETEYTIYAEACETERERHFAAMYFAWRWHFADEMIAARKVVQS